MRFNCLPINKPLRDKSACLLSCVVILIHFFSPCFAAEPVTPAYQKVQSLEDEWLVYDAEYRTYVPFIREKHGVPDALYLHLNLNNYRGYQLSLFSPQSVYLFTQAQLQTLVPANQTVALDIDSLYTQHKQTRLLITLYRADGHAAMPSAAIVYPTQQKPENIAAATALQTNRIDRNAPLKNFIIISLLLIMALYAFLWNYHPKAFKSYYNAAAMFSFSFKEDTVLISRPLSNISLLFIYNHSLLLSFLYIVIQKGSGRLLLNDPVLQAASSFGDLMGYFFGLSVLIFLLNIGKYLFIYTLGSLFNLSQVIYIHFYEYLLLSRFFYNIVAILVFILVVSAPQTLPFLYGTVVLLIIAFSIIRLLIINFALNRQTSVKTLYLFSYLCATELIPILIGFKILVQ